jgi:hypothetical protein
MADLLYTRDIPISPYTSRAYRSARITVHAYGFRHDCLKIYTGTVEHECHHRDSFPCKSIRPAWNLAASDGMKHSTDDNRKAPASAALRRSSETSILRRTRMRCIAVALDNIMLLAHTFSLLIISGKHDGSRTGRHAQHQTTFRFLGFSCTCHR